MSARVAARLLASIPRRHVRVQARNLRRRELARFSGRIGPGWRRGVPAGRAPSGCGRLSSLLPVLALRTRVRQRCRTRPTRCRPSASSCPCRRRGAIARPRGLVEACGAGLESLEHLAEELHLLDRSGVPWVLATRGRTSPCVARLSPRQLGEFVFEAARPRDLGIQALRRQRPQLLCTCRGHQGKLLLGAQLARPREVERHAWVASRTRATRACR